MERTAVEYALSLGREKENLAKALGRIRRGRDRLRDNPSWRLSEVEIDMMILCAIVDGLLDGSINPEEFREVSDRFVCQKCGKERPRNGFACWYCGAK